MKKQTNITTETVCPDLVQERKTLAERSLENDVYKKFRIGYINLVTELDLEPQPAFWWVLWPEVKLAAEQIGLKEIKEIIDIMVRRAFEAIDPDHPGCCECNHEPEEAGFITVETITPEVQRCLENEHNCHLCLPDKLDNRRDRFEKLPLPDGKHPCVADHFDGRITRDVEVRNGHANLLDIFKLTGEHTEVDPDHQFIEDIHMLDKKTISVWYGS